MGRKIPVRKHLGVKDPLQQKKQREQKLSKVRDAPPPKNDQDDPLPRRLQEINKLRQMVKDGKFDKPKVKKKKQKKELPPGFLKAPLSTEAFLGPTPKLLRGMKRPEKQIPTIQQRPGESDKAFFHRCNVLCDQLIKEVKYEEKYKVDIVRDAETGLIEGLKKQEKDEVEEMMKEEAKKVTEEKKTKKRKITKKKQAEMAAAKAEKEFLKKHRKKLKKLKKIDKKLEKSKEEGLVKHETIKFGEVVDRPPEIKVKPRKAIAEKNVKNIMFNQMLIQGKLAEEMSKTKPSNAKSKQAGKPALSGKRKDLPVGQRRLLEAQQKSVVAAYRLMKAKKMNKEVM
ncbi:coiled-coil domain-containing protein 137 [Thrips palmi]|uniref:Coiled-coil domain-containing protein 137 n=1 Tax=Thrips palmi TaxID=161013 RepID=A0A6P8ZAJ5_THRPL|nr:coiled-coil domain-containing protein 137 [Thrips palmi]